MDNCLEEFTEQLESSFNAESLIPKKQDGSRWLTRLFSNRKLVRQSGEKGVSNREFAHDNYLMSGRNTLKPAVGSNG